MICFTAVKACVEPATHFGCVEIQKNELPVNHRLLDNSYLGICAQLTNFVSAPAPPLKKCSVDCPRPSNGMSKKIRVVFSPPGDLLSTEYLSLNRSCVTFLDEARFTITFCFYSFLSWPAFKEYIYICIYIYIYLLRETERKKKTIIECTLNRD